MRVAGAEVQGSILPVHGRCQSRAHAGRSGALYGVVASKGFDETPLSGGITEHARAAFRRFDEVLEAAGLARSDVCSVTVYLQDILADVEGFNAEWRSYFAGLSPARCCIGATLQAGMLVEMTFIAEHPVTASAPDTGPQ